MNPHDQLGVWESTRGAALICCECGGNAQGNYGCADGCGDCSGGGHICNACIEADEKGANHEHL